MIICIDGIDGIGKTTVCNLLRMEIGAEILKVRVSNEEQSYFNSLKLIDSKFLFWFQKFIESYNEIDINDKKKYIIDRSIYSNIIYHKLFGCKLSIQEFEQLVPKIEYKFFLTSDYETWKDRFLKKKSFDFYENKIYEKKDFKIELEKEYSALGFIKVNNNNIKDTIKQIVNHLI